MFMNEKGYPIVWQFDNFEQFNDLFSHVINAIDSYHNKELEKCH